MSEWHAYYDGEGNFAGVREDVNPVIPFYESDAARMERISLEQITPESLRQVADDGRMYVTPEKPESGGVLGCLVVLAIVAAVIFLAGWV